MTAKIKVNPASLTGAISQLEILANFFAQAMVGSDGTIDRITVVPGIQGRDRFCARKSPEYQQLDAESSHRAIVIDAKHFDASQPDWLPNLFIQTMHETAEMVAKVLHKKIGSGCWHTETFRDLMAKVGAEFKPTKGTGALENFGFVGLKLTDKRRARIAEILAELKINESAFTVARVERPAKPTTSDNNRVKFGCEDMFIWVSGKQAEEMAKGLHSCENGHDWAIIS